jgi:hypothetical protein
VASIIHIASNCGFYATVFMKGAYTIHFTSSCGFYATVFKKGAYTIHFSSSCGLYSSVLIRGLIQHILLAVVAYMHLFKITWHEQYILLLFVIYKQRF